MKIILALYFAVSLSAFAADPVFRVDESGGVFRNEVNTNMDVADYVRNNPSEASLVAGAFRARVLDNRAKVATETKAAQDAAASEVAAKEAAATSEAEKLKARIAELEEQIAALQKKLDAAGAEVVKL